MGAPPLQRQPFIAACVPQLLAALDHSQGGTTRIAIQDGAPVISTLG